MLKTLAMTLVATGLIASQPALAADKTSLKISSPWEIASYEPSVSGFAFYRLGVMETLVDASVDGVLEPGLATEWTMADDGLSWSFTLREGVNFHDGSELTAEIAANALNLAFAKPSMLQKAPISSIVAEQGKIIIALEKPFSALPALLTHNTTVIAAPASLDAEGKHIAAIGTGPFEIDQFTPPQGLDVKRYEEYWGEDRPKGSILFYYP